MFDLKNGLPPFKSERRRVAANFQHQGQVDEFGSSYGTLLNATGKIAPAKFTFGKALMQLKFKPTV